MRVSQTLFKIQWPGTAGGWRSLIGPLSLWTGVSIEKPGLLCYSCWIPRKREREICSKILVLVASADYSGATNAQRQNGRRAKTQSSTRGRYLQLAAPRNITADLRSDFKRASLWLGERSSNHPRLRKSSRSARYRCQGSR
ncbi:uncharacterized protein LOC104449100 [Eucalyptus grandis]|uniref:uncharacterized protein LOC104449100 n=1 Tax=Eucalyptus grandis TaxID=71139 RepID=UPI00052659C9|nr:uncharacterized protein LOC104449100 [Eucalyptus grandis]